MIKDLKNILVLDSLRAKILLVLCCIVCYVNVVKNDYAMDDDFAFYANTYVQEGVKGIPDILTHPYYSSGNISVDYRPVASITFAIEKELFGNNPHISHGVNLIFYILCVLLVLALLTEVFSLSLVPAFLAALFFAVHPAHVEVVASIKNREELLSFIFCLLGFISVHRYFLQSTTAGSVKYALLALVCLLLSFASKLTSIPVFVIILITLYFNRSYRKGKMFYPLVIAIAVLSITYLVVIVCMSNRPVFDLENPLVMYHDLSTKIGTTAASLLFYFRFMWVPYPFSFFYGYNTIPVAQADDPVAVLSIFIHLALFVFGSILFFRRNIAGLFILAYFISMALYSNILIPYTGIVSERALFFSSMWFIAAVSCLLYDKASSAKGVLSSGFAKTAMMSITAIVLIIYGVLDINRVGQWKDTLTLMSSDVKHLDNSTLANYFYANVLKVKAESERDTASARRYLSEAKKYYYQTNNISRSYLYGYYRLGLIYRYDEYNTDSALYYFNRAYSLSVSTNQMEKDVQFEYGRSQCEYGDKNKAANAFADLYQKFPEDTFVIFYHSYLLLKTGNLQEGKRIVDRLYQMAPGYYQPHSNLGIYYDLSNDTENAVKEYAIAVKLGYQDQYVYRYLINYYDNHGRQQEADGLRKLLR